MEAHCEDSDSDCESGRAKRAQNRPLISGNLSFMSGRNVSDPASYLQNTELNIFTKYTC